MKSREGEGTVRKDGSPPFSPRARARQTYRSRRRRLLEVPVDALSDRFGSEAVVVDREEARSARVEIASDLRIEVGFAGVFRMFGALIDTQWVGVAGSPGAVSTQLEYRFDRRRFVVKKGDRLDLATHLGDEVTTALAKRAELKAIKVDDSPSGRIVTITPLAGTITAVYFPPMPPYSVPIKLEEAKDHITLLLHLLEAG